MKKASRVIDVHCHVLPGLDDGAADAEAALALARMAAADGTRRMLATPHHLNGLFSNPPAQIRIAVQDFQSRLDAEKIRLKIHAGAEVHLVPDLVAHLERDEVMTLGDHRKYLMIEFPPFMMPPNTKQILFEIRRLGLGVVLAHPERIEPFSVKPELLDELIDAGALVQLTAGSILGQFGKPVRKLSERLLDERRVHFIASDAHNTDGRTPVLSVARKAVVRHIGENGAQILFETNPLALVEGREILQ